MKIYIAGSFIDQKRLRKEAERFWDIGHEITGTWLLEVARPIEMTSEEFKCKLAFKDTAEVYAADLIILDNLQSSGGKNVEWGIGIGQFQKKLLWLIGEPSNVFHYIADKRFQNWDECLAFIKKKELHPDVKV